MKRHILPVTLLLLLCPAARAETVTLATYNVAHFQDHFRAFELGKKLPKPVADPVLKDLLDSERRHNDEDNWEVAQVILDERFSPDVLVIQEGCSQSNLDYFNRRWLRGAYATAIAFPTNTGDREQNLCMLLKPGFKVIDRKDRYYLEKDPTPNARGDRLFARGPAFCLVQTPSGYKVWVGVTHQKSKRVDVEPAAAADGQQPRADRADAARREPDEATKAATAKAAAEAAAWRNREAKRTHEIMKELERAGPADVVLLGDMNDDLGEDEAEKAAGGDAVSLLVGPDADGFVLATRPLADKGEISFGGYWRTDFRSLIDHVVVTRGVKDRIAEVGVFRSSVAPVASDHFPVYVKVKTDRK